MFRSNNRKARLKCKICSMLPMKLFWCLDNYIKTDFTFWSAVLIVEYVHGAGFLYSMIKARRKVHVYTFSNFQILTFVASVSDAKYLSLEIGYLFSFKNPILDFTSFSSTKLVSLKSYSTSSLLHL